MIIKIVTRIVGQDRRLRLCGITVSQLRLKDGLVLCVATCDHVAVSINSHGLEFSRLKFTADHSWCSELLAAETSSTNYFANKAEHDHT